LKTNLHRQASVRQRPSKNPFASENQLINRAEKPAKTGPKGVKVSVGFPPAEIGVETWKLAEFLNTPRRLGALGHATTEEGHRLLTAEWSEEERIRQDARNLMLLEWAKELLLDEE
jgi:hypothetical protein